LHCKNIVIGRVFQCVPISLIWFRTMDCTKCALERCLVRCLVRCRTGCGLGPIASSPETGSVGAAAAGAIGATDAESMETRDPMQSSMDTSLLLGCSSLGPFPEQHHSEYMTQLSAGSCAPPSEAAAPPTKVPKAPLVAAFVHPCKRCGKAYQSWNRDRSLPTGGVRGYCGFDCFEGHDGVGYTRYLELTTAPSNGAAPLARRTRTMNTWPGAKIQSAIINFATSNQSRGREAVCLFNDQKTLSYGLCAAVVSEAPAHD